jgi:hypothetical protein
LKGRKYVPAAAAQPIVPIAWAIRTSVVILIVCLDVFGNGLQGNVARGDNVGSS